MQVAESQTNSSALDLFTHLMKVLRTVLKRFCRQAGAKGVPLLRLTHTFGIFVMHRWRRPDLMHKICNAAPQSYAEAPSQPISCAFF